MPTIAKLFIKDHSQMVELPEAFRFKETEVFIYRNTITGEVALSSTPPAWQTFFDLADDTAIPENWMADRHDSPPKERHFP